MPLTVSNLATNEANLSLDIAGETLNLVYYPGRVTTNVISQIDNELDGMSQTLSKIIKSWDLLDDNGAMYPITPDALSELGRGLLIKVARGIIQDIRPN